jgi:hypothetical protein
MDYLSELKKFHAENVEPYKGKAVGCSQEEIKELETKIGYPFPEAYRQYLEWMGKDYHGAFVGSNWFITDVIGNTEYLPELLAENKVDLKLPEHYLVFFSHQGYMAAWFELPKENDNPTVYFFTEGKESPVVTVEGKFTDCLFEDMRGMASFLPKIYKTK